jgi:hypothetical protein
MVGGIFPDTQSMITARNLAVQQAQAQNVAIQNVNMARAEAERHAQKGSFTTIPTATGQTIMRSNAIGYSAPSIQTRNLTPNGPVQRAMSPSMVTPLEANRPLFTSRPFSTGSGTQNRRII